MSTITKTYTFWITFRPTPDIPGEWTAHCLELDTISTGFSLEHAIQMIGEAVLLILEDDLRRGFDPLARRAPEEDWAELHELLRTGKSLGSEMPAVIEHAKATPGTYATNMVTTISLRSPELEGKKGKVRKVPHETPRPLFMLAGR